MASEDAINLFTTAAANAGQLDEALEARLAGASTDAASRLKRMAELIQRDGRISINMRQATLNSFLTFGNYQNIYEWTRWLAEKSTKSAEEILRDKLDTFYRRRVSFDRHFEDGEHFRYGALNVGGLGPASYGEYCIVLADSLSSGRAEVAYLRSDSLKTYLLPDATIDQTKLSRDAATHSQRHSLAVIKHADEIPATDEDRWPALVCSDAAYIEAIFVGDVRQGDVETVRISWLDFEIRFHYVFEEFRSKLDLAERFLVEEFAMIWRHLDEQNMNLEVIRDV